MLRRLFVVLASLLVPLAVMPAGAANRMLVVYPFAVNGATPEGMGTQVTDKIAGEITALGGINVVRGSATANPADYRTAARAAGADVYFSGSIVPVGAGYSAIEHLVSTRSGTVVWAATVSFRSLADVTGQGTRVHDELLRGEPSPPPGTTAAGTSLITPAPMNGFAVLPVTGSAIEGDRTYALRAILETLKRRGSSAVSVTSATPIPDGVALCNSSGARTLIVGTLDTTHVATSGSTPQTTAHLALQTYDCGKHALDLQPTVVNHIAPIANDAIRGAIEDAISAFPAPS
jgi:TolB-like protein